MKTILFAAFVWVGSAGAAEARVPADAPVLLAQAGKSSSSTTTSSDDDDDDVPAATPASTPKPTEPKKDDSKKTAVTPAPAATPAASTAATATTAATSAPPAGESLILISGAPLNNPNVGVHTVEQKAASDSGRSEVVIYPVAMQVNGKFTQHFGTMASFVYHLQENFGLQLTGGYNWYSAESSFNGELVEKFRAEAQAATSLLWTWGVLGGVEVTPLYGKFAFFEGTLVHFSVVINGGAGLGGTRHQLKPETTRQDDSISPATYGDTGLRFMGSLGAGFRLQIGQHFALRLEVRDVVYTARVERLNGCNATDLAAMDTALKMGKDPSTVTTLTSACDVSTFTGTYEGTDIKRSNDVPLAHKLVAEPSSDVLNNIGLYLGASFVF